MSKTVLVADDSESIRNIVKLSLKLQRPDIKVIEATNGSEAYEIIKGTPIDLLITDVDMPYMSGLELVKLIRTELKNETLPILICTAEKLKNPGELTKDGISKILNKPFSAKELLDTVKEII